MSNADSQEKSLIPTHHFLSDSVCIRQHDEGLCRKDINCYRSVAVDNLRDMIHEGIHSGEIQCVSLPGETIENVNQIIR